MFDFAVVAGGELGEDGDSDSGLIEWLSGKSVVENTEKPYKELSRNFYSVKVFCFSRTKV